MKKLISIVLVSLAVPLLRAEFSAGFARLDITPPPGLPMPGYFSKRIGDGVLDPLCVECVAVSDGTNDALIYSVDDLHLTGPFFEKAFPAITAATGVPRDRIYVHSTHTHTGVADMPRGSYTPEENQLVTSYAELRVAKLADAGRAALADRAPATISIGQTECKGVSFIRRYRMKDGSSRTNPGTSNPDVVAAIGTPDESLRVVRFKRKGAPDIAIINFGTHPDTVGGTKYSADWPGVVRQTFESAIGGGVKCLFLNGAQGDVNHHMRLPPPARQALYAARGNGTNPKAIATFMGRAVAGAAISVWDICEDVPSGPVRGIVKAHPLPTNRPSADEIKWIELFDAGRKNEIPLKGMELTTLTSPGGRARALKDGPDSREILISTLVIGDALAFAGIPGEPYVDIGRAIKAQSPFATTIISCLTNGSHGYFPSTQAHQEGGYEGLSSWFAAPAGDMIVAAGVTQLKELRGQNKE